MAKESAVYAQEVAEFLAQVVWLTVRDIRADLAQKWESKGGCERPAVNELLLSLKWSVDDVFSWDHSRHINLLEAQVCRRWEESCFPSPGSPSGRES